MGEGRSIWIGKDEHHGVRAEPRSDLRPPPHWRLEAIAHTPRPRTLSVGADRRSAVFIEDRQSSDVWLLDLEGGSPPERLTTGRELVAYWEDTTPHLSPDGSSVAYADRGHVWLVPSAGGPPRKLVEGDSPRWIDDRRLLIAVEREEDRTTRIAVIDVSDPWPRRLASGHGELDAHGDEGEPVPSPDGAEVAYTFTPRAYQNRSSEIRVATIDTGEVRRLSGVPDMRDGGHGALRAGVPRPHQEGRDLEAVVGLVGDVLELGERRVPDRQRRRRVDSCRLALGRDAAKLGRRRVVVVADHQVAGRGEVRRVPHTAAGELRGTAV